ncbi:hypothetical protein BDV06DRAFT_218065 [Aspergillus oleicola]
MPVSAYLQLDLSLFPAAALSTLQRFYLPPFISHDAYNRRSLYPPSQSHPGIYRASPENPRDLVAPSLYTEYDPTSPDQVTTPNPNKGDQNKHVLKGKDKGAAPAASCFADSGGFSRITSALCSP